MRRDQCYRKPSIFQSPIHSKVSTTAPTVIRVIARSREVPNTPLIASSKISAVQVEKIRSVLIALNSSESGAAILKQIGVIGGFRETSRAEFLDMLTWLGELEIAKQ